MREIVTQLALALIVWSLAVELAGWAMQRCFGEQWWQSLLGERKMQPVERIANPLGRE